MKVNWLTLSLRIVEAAMAVIILGLIGRIDVKIKQARVKYIMAVGAIGTALCGLYGIPMEFVHFKYNRWILALIDCIAGLMLLAAAIIAADDIHTCNAVAVVVGNETCKLVKAATAFAFADCFFALVLFAYEVYLIVKGKDQDDGFAFPPAHTKSESPQKSEA